MNENIYKYDVAISFLFQDEPTARALYSSLGTGLRVFFYPRNQEELAGTDGLESMRRPFLQESIVSVVLYRMLWGKTPWTRVEETAIKDGCLQRGWQQLFFMTLVDNDPLPVWLPTTHVRFSYANFGLEQAVGAIKARVQECGGIIAPTTALTRARLVQAEADRLTRKEALFSSQQWIQGPVRQAIDDAFENITDLALQIASELKMPIRSGKSQNTCSLTDHRVGLSVVWKQSYVNVMGNILILEYHNSIILPGENKCYIMGDPPPVMERTTIKPDLSADDSLCWISEDKPHEQISTSRLADFIVQKFMKLCEDANSGDIDTMPEFRKRF